MFEPGTGGQPVTSTLRRICFATHRAQRTKYKCMCGACVRARNCTSKSLHFRSCWIHMAPLSPSLRHVPGGACAGPGAWRQSPAAPHRRPHRQPRRPARIARADQARTCGSHRCRRGGAAPAPASRGSRGRGRTAHCCRRAGPAPAGRRQKAAGCVFVAVAGPLALLRCASTSHPCKWL